MGGIVCAGALAALAGTASADPAVWLNAVSGVWSDASNWSTDPVFPNNNGTTFEVFIQVTGAPYTVTLDLPITINEMNLLSLDATLDLNGFSLSVLGDWNQSQARLFGAGSVTVASSTFSDGAILQSVGTYNSTGAMVFGGGPLIATICDTGIDHTGSTISWLTGGDILIRNGAQFFNRGPSVFTISGSGSLFWDSLGPQPEFVNEGSIVKDTDAGVTFFDGVAFSNTGTLRVETGTFRTDGVTLVGNTLSQGTWQAVNGSTIDLIGVAIDTIDARVLLDGAGADVFDSGLGQSALTNLATIGPSGRFEIFSGRDFVTTGSFTLDAGAELAVGAATSFEIGAGTLTNLAGGVLTDGRYEIAGTLGVTEDVTAIDAGVRLEGVGSDIVNLGTAQSAIAGLTDLIGGGRLELGGGRDFTAATGVTFTVGAIASLSIESGSEFFVPEGSTLGNLSGGVFSLGVFDVQDGGTLRIFGGAASVVDADVSLVGANSRIVDENDNDVFASLNQIDFGGNLRLLDGRDLTTLGDLDIAGGLVLGSESLGQSGSTLTVNGDLDQAAGTIALDGGVINATGEVRLGGTLVGNGVINGETVASGEIGAGQSPGTLRFGDNLTLARADGAEPLIIIELGGLIPGEEHDQIIIDGTLHFDDGVGGNAAGVLRIELIEGFIPEFGAEFAAILFSAIDGEFAQFHGLQLPGGRSLVVEARDDGLYLVTIPAPGGLGLLLAASALGVRRRRR